MNKILLGWITAFLLLTLTLLAAPTHYFFEKTSCQNDMQCAVNQRCLQSPKICTPVLGKAPLASLALAASLGRKETASDFIWLKIIQYVGSPYSIESQYEGIEDWIAVETTLDPTVELPYFMGGILLSTFPERAKAADALFALGQKNLGDNWELSMWRGYIAYFSIFDLQKAAFHFEKAAELGAPPIFARRAQTLRKQDLNCNEIIHSLRSVKLDVQKLQGADALSNAGELQVYSRCWEKSLDRILQLRRTQKRPTLSSLNTLVDEGLLEKIPPLPTGQCWRIITGTVKMKPCENLQNKAQK